MHGGRLLLPFLFQTDNDNITLLFIDAQIEQNLLRAFDRTFRLYYNE
jgi:hypothetical protein